MSNIRPSTYKYYEMGLRAGDWMSVLDTIEHREEWAIVFDRSNDQYFQPRYEVWVNGQKVDETTDFAAAEAEINKYLRGQLKAPGG
jgi:hypothetical protein